MLFRFKFCVQIEFKLEIFIYSVKLPHLYNLNSQELGWIGTPTLKKRVEGVLLGAKMPLTLTKVLTSMNSKLCTTINPLVVPKWMNCSPQGTDSETLLTR